MKETLTGFLVVQETESPGEMLRDLQSSDEQGGFYTERQDAEAHRFYRNKHSAVPLKVMAVTVTIEDIE